MASSSDGEEELHSMLGLSVGDLDDVASEEDGAEAQSEDEGSRSRLGGPVLICDDAHESAEAFGAYCSGADRAAPPWKLDVEDRPELVEQLVRRCFDGAVARAVEGWLRGCGATLEDKGRHFGFVRASVGAGATSCCFGPGAALRRYRHAPSGAVTLTSMPSVASKRVISATSSRWRKPSAVGPSRLTLDRRPSRGGRAPVSASARTNW